MTSKALPVRPSLASLRKQAKKLARDVANGDADAIGRARMHAPQASLPLSQRNAQLVIAREYGYAGWQELIEEVSRRLGTTLDRAAAQAKRAIHDNDVRRLEQLLAEFPALLSWQADRGDGLLEFATGAYADSFDPDRERTFTRPQCAELLLDAGAPVTISVCEGILDSRARGLLRLFQRRGLLPHTLKNFAALGDLDAVRVALVENGADRAAVNEAFLRACSFEHEPVASWLLEPAIELDSQLAGEVRESGGPLAFIKSLIENRSHYFAADEPPRDVFLKQQVKRAIHGRDVGAFVTWLRRERRFVGESHLAFQAGVIETATLNDRGEFITALFELDPAILRHDPPPPSQAIEFAFTYGTAHLIPLLTRIWLLPDDLPHAAGIGDLSRVKRWFDPSGAVALGNPDDHYPWNDPRARSHLHWSTPTVQQVLDTALAFSVINHHFEAADFLLDHGADINTNWNSHEPASILHHLVFQDDYEAMQYLIDRNIDMAIKDYRWNSTARGWAIYGKNDAEMAAWLDAAERRRKELRDRPPSV